MKPITLQGHWWLPKSPDNPQVGTLTFDQTSGARLSVVGHLSPLGTGFVRMGEEYSVIHGFTTNGKPITLLETRVVNSRISLPGIATETWYARMVAIGAHFNHSAEALFHRSWIRFDGIAQWLAYDPFIETFRLGPPFVELAVRKPKRIELARLIHDGPAVGYSAPALPLGA